VFVSRCSSYCADDCCSPSPLQHPPSSFLLLIILFSFSSTPRPVLHAFAQTMQPVSLLRTPCYFTHQCCDCPFPFFRYTLLQYYLQPWPIHTFPHVASMRLLALANYIPRSIYCNPLSLFTTFKRFRLRMRTPHVTRHTSHVTLLFMSTFFKLRGVSLQAPPSFLASNAIAAILFNNVDIRSMGVRRQKILQLSILHLLKHF
jgi:hypothetical protein